MRHTATDEEAKGQAALYALGALDAEEARAFEEHLGGGCAVCAAEVEGFEAAVAALGEAAPPAEPPPAVRARLIACVGEDGSERESERGPAREARDAGAGGHAAAAGFFILRAGEGEWVETEDEGVSYKLLFADSERGTVTTLVRMRPGARIPSHRHLGVEQCLVLEGDLRSGPYAMGAGDFNCSLPDSVHDELVTDGGALLLLVSPASYERLGPHSR